MALPNVAKYIQRLTGCSREEALEINNIVYTAMVHKFFEMGYVDTPFGKLKLVGSFNAVKGWTLKPVFDKYGALNSYLSNYAKEHMINSYMSADHYAILAEAQKKMEESSKTIADGLLEFRRTT